MNYNYANTGTVKQFGTNFFKGGGSVTKWHKMLLFFFVFFLVTDTV